MMVKKVGQSLGYDCNRLDGRELKTLNTWTFVNDNSNQFAAHGFHLLFIIIYNLLLRKDVQKRAKYFKKDHKFTENWRIRF